MNLKITAVGTSTASNSSIQLATEAIASCLKKTNINHQEIDYLINVGIYRDENMVEPSMAALIQKKSEINLDFIKFNTPVTTFSFDLMNGASGAINAFHVASNFMKTKDKNYCLVVSSDNHPGGQSDKNFPITKYGGAFLLEKSKDTNKGFQNFYFTNTKDLEIGFEGYIDLDEYTTSSRTNITIVQHANYIQKLGIFLGNEVLAYMKKNQLNVSNTLLITTQQSSDFSFQVAQIAGIPEDQVISLKEFGNPHTSCFAIGFEHLLEQELAKKNQNVLFVGGTGGLSCSIAWYKL